MTISSSYLAKLKERVISDFLVANHRSPTADELRLLMIEAQTQYANLDEIGFTGYHINKPKFHVASSAADENENRRAIFDDLFTLLDRVDHLTEVLEDGFAGFKASATRTKHLLSKTESRLDNLLLLHGHTDSFVYGIEETFDTQEYIDHANSTASVESNYVTMGRRGYKRYDLANVKLTASAVSERGVLNITNVTSIDTLKEVDGVFWEYIIYTKFRQGRVTLTLDIVLDENTDITDLRFTAMPISANNRMTYTVLYSTDGSAYSALEPVELVALSGENHVPVGIKQVKAFRILFSKEVADTNTMSDNQYVYLFGLDNIELLTDAYRSDEESVLIAGPYAFVDVENRPINFTKATLDACTITDDETSVNFFLSKDGSTYLPIDYQGLSLGVVSFLNGDQASTSGVIDSTASTYALKSEVLNAVNLTYAVDAVLNQYILSAYSSEVPLTSIYLKRGVVDTSNRLNIYGAPSGWRYDRFTRQYSTTVYVSRVGGKMIDLGHTGAFVNGMPVSGYVYLPEGYSVFSTSDSNWVEITTGLTTLDTLRAADPLYPYNHRYLIEGYTYPNTFNGEQVYNGVEEYFSELLEYVTPELFETLGSDRKDIFTIDANSGNTYFKIKVDKSDASWKDELCSVTWSVHKDTTNEIYVKAVLNSTNVNKTPRIDSFSIRVI